ncbi:hypothetical protein HOD38_01245 [archaeon]|jgi:archaellum biogenesis protein FlaJ (TadC family)|nr:hypothetical protein [archaeon]MBT4396870.1 hypothetical protein [archaeon]MBT4441452.1 hypothetical protein [archaeon]
MKGIYVKIANLAFEPLTNFTIKIFPKFYNNLQKNIVYSGMPVLSITYLSIMYLTTFLILAIGSALSVILLYAYVMFYPLMITAVMVIISVLLFLIVPKLKANEKRNRIERNLPFTISLLAALSEIGLTKLDLFKPLLKSRDSKIEALRIINFTQLKKTSLAEALLETSQLTPSDRYRVFLQNLAKRINNPQQTLAYLKEKAESTLREHKRRVVKNLWRETKAIFFSLKFKIKYLIFVIISLVLMVVCFFFLFDFATFDAPFYFYLLLLIVIIIAWSPVFYDINKKFKTDREQEREFVKFTRELSKTPVGKIDKNFGIISFNTQKLVNQYKMGITRNNLLNNMAKDMNNSTIKEIIDITLETNRDPFKVLPIMTKPLIHKNKVKFQHVAKLKSKTSQTK